MDAWTTRFLALTTMALADLDSDVDISGAVLDATTKAEGGVLVMRENGHAVSAAPSPDVPPGAIYYRD